MDSMGIPSGRGDTVSTIMILMMTAVTMTTKASTKKATCHQKNESMSKMDSTEWTCRILASGSFAGSTMLTHAAGRWWSLPILHIFDFSIMIR